MLEKTTVTNHEKEIKKLTGKLHGSSTIAQNKKEEEIEVLSELISVWENVTDSHRENMRGHVESHATDVFMSLTNKKRSYGGLKISKDFQIDIVNKKGKPVAGSSGQSALMAYSVLDALTRSSDIEFPLVVDTPARSIDDENLEVSYRQDESPAYKENNAVKVESKYGIKIHHLVKKGKS